MYNFMGFQLTFEETMKVTLVTMMLTYIVTVHVVS